ncbi:MAG: hypothetical protein PUG10_00305 [Lachnospiraceae bacterium]|nr:hypothetical protein [Lachnospiraceae bacterium]
MDKVYIERALMSAEGFGAAAKLLMEKTNKNAWYLGIYAPAITANLSFACEIYMKQIIGFNEEKYTKGHYLRDLYRKISPQEREFIEGEFDEKVKSFLRKNSDWMEPFSINNCLDDYNKAFEEWRYVYEPKESNAYFVAGPSLEILACVLEEYIKDKLG